MFRKAALSELKKLKVMLRAAEQLEEVISAAEAAASDVRSLEKKRDDLQREIPQLEANLDAVRKSLKDEQSAAAVEKDKFRKEVAQARREANSAIDAAKKDEQEQLRAMRDRVADAEKATEQKIKELKASEDEALARAKEAKGELDKLRSKLGVS